MWTHEKPTEPGVYWVRFKSDPRIFEVRLFGKPPRLEYEIKHRDWSAWLDKRPYSEFLTIFGGVLAYAARVTDTPPDITSSAPS
jgi:hypothetical protein